MDSILVSNGFTTSEIIAFGSLLVPLFAFAFSSYRYVNVKRGEQAQQHFENYHELIHKLVTAGSDGIGMDSQKAIIFELRNYREYKSVTIRILEWLKVSWSKHPALIEEIELTLANLNRMKPFHLLT
ncbi:hypothetical protein FCV43_10815 [Vibrio genomosp. F6]|uniref:hypothetical protein n=1 Tax=Vibrio genomosp. F6 TaxID=723172 RepID=UPI0010BD1FCF|nr:hypothetical protein [Vibrio genomosp. F6]TKF21804.1 hypothetical protein FCV43_10815 [Vibrio genomosp. F6]